MSDTEPLNSVQPIKSLDQIERETGGAATPVTPVDTREGEDRSFLGALVAPFIGTAEGDRPDPTTAPPSETTENSEG
ncbi:hypothetical protein [Deinococcus aetherius]|nr:hypothetical protein [Deinococcus aetherius]